MNLLNFYFKFTAQKMSSSIKQTVTLMLLVVSVVLSPIVFAERDTSRDQYRHPFETLAFFGVQPEMDVLEISPGGGWYTEILAGYVSGDLIAGHYDPASDVAYYQRSLKRFQDKLAANPDLYGRVKMAIFDAGARKLNVADASVDAVVTFRNVHNWMGSKSEGSSFELFYAALKPGGVLGVVEHRAAPGTDRATMRKSGYMTQAYVIELAEKAGFVLEASSEVNANPKDTADHPKGVWTLPPSLRLGEEDREKYLAIGESDRMTLRFRKPASDN
jgi:predicted methyltransferase